MTEEDKKILKQFEINSSIQEDDEAVKQICYSIRPLPQSFMKKWADCLDWKTICTTQHLKNKFMDEMCDYIDFKMISWSQRLTEWFMEKWKNQLDWISISNRQEMSKEFIIDHIEYIELECLFDNKRVRKYGEDFFRTLLEAKSHSSLYTLNLSFVNYNFSIDFVREFRSNFQIISGKLIKSRERKDWKEFDINFWSL